MVVTVDEDCDNDDEGNVVDDDVMTSCWVDAVAGERDDVEVLLDPDAKIFPKLSRKTP